MIVFFLSLLSAQAQAANVYHSFDLALGAFDKSLKKHQVNGLNDLAIRNLSYSPYVPADLKAKIELLISKQIMDTAGTRVVHCIVCRTMQDTRNTTTPEQLRKMALQNHIANFMDVKVSESAVSQSLDLSLAIHAVRNNAQVWSEIYHVENEKVTESNDPLLPQISRSLTPKTIPLSRGDEILSGPSHAP